MGVRSLAAVSVVTPAIAPFSVPVVNAHGETAASDAGSLSGVPGGSVEAPEGDAGSGAESGSLESGSPESGSLESGSMSELAPGGAPDGPCSLPGLGGSIGTSCPLFGISGIPSVIITLATSARDVVPTLLDIVAGTGGGASLVGASGSLEGPLCTTLRHGPDLPRGFGPSSCPGSGMWPV